MNMVIQIDGKYLSDVDRPILRAVIVPNKLVNLVTDHPKKEGKTYILSELLDAFGNIHKTVATKNEDGTETQVAYQILKGGVEVIWLSPEWKPPLE